MGSEMCIRDSTPTENTDGASFDTLEPIQLSSNVGVPKSTLVASHKPKSAVCVTAVGHVIVGFSSSVIVTSCSHVASFPEASTTVHVTTVTPTGYTDGASFDTLEPIQLSLNVGVPKSTLVASHKPESAVCVTAVGHVIVGFSLSDTITLNPQLAVKPALSPMT